VGKINVLSFAVANLIAAGEVVDRPSSVIKELLENAIDSGATRITVEIKNGGVTYMRVSDNGCGMEPDDLPIAIRRHATSKIKNAEDLEGIITLGFRGEALAAIASVSDMRIISKTAKAENGAVLEAHAGNILAVRERACADGTTVIVENLFANVPARRKFLKKDITEAMAINAVVEKIALSKPHIAFKLISDETVKLETVGDSNLKNTIYSIFGRDFASKIIEASIEIDGIKVKGYIGRSDNVRANRNYQNFFINGRYVRSKTAMAAIEQAYTSYIPSEKFPCCVLFIDINPATVDVNVHPAKLEVKFSNEKPVFEAVYYAVRNALEASTSRPDILLGANKPVHREVDMPKPTKPRVSDAAFPIKEGREESLRSRQLESELFVSAPKPENIVSHSAVSSDKKEEKFVHISAKEYVSKYVESEEKKANNIEPKVTVQSASDNKAFKIDEKKVEQAVKESLEIKTDVKEIAEPVPTAEEPKSLKYRIIGEAFNSYIIVEVGDKMLLIDKHAAHERIIFEKLKAAMYAQKNSISQMLMFPIEIMMTSDEIEAIKEYKSEIENMGFEFGAGKYTLNVTAIPDGIRPEAVIDMFEVMADRIKNNTGSARLTRDLVFEKALYQASCKAAIKAGREYADEHRDYIVAKLMELPDITVCPHGRPVAMEISKKNLDTQFERG